MSDPAQALKDFKQEKKFLVGIDSDGCAFDTMEIKHKECFIPNIINEWDMQAISKYARQAAEFVNLYSKWRGINRFPALIMVFDLLSEREEVKRRGVKMPQIDSLRKWAKTETKLANPALEKAVKEILSAIGDDPNREGLKDTPKRVARMYAELFAGMNKDPGKELTVFHEADHEEMVMVKDIPFYSMCEHHLVPFFGKAHVVYIPTRGKVTGLSKLVRVIEGFAKRPQVQERLTSQIADCLMEGLKPQGVMIVIEAEHLCMSMRGVKKPGAITTTSALRGIFQKNAKTRSEALSLIKS